MFAEGSKIDTRRGIPLPGSIAGPKFQGDILVAIGNPQWGISCRTLPSGRWWLNFSGDICRELPRSISWSLGFGSNGFRLRVDSLTLAAGRGFYTDLLEAGIRIFELHGMVLHSKFATIDGVWTAVGSSNFDRRSVNFNNEVDAIVFGRETAHAAGALFDRDISRSEPIDLAHWHNRPFNERSHEFFSRLWEFLM